MRSCESGMANMFYINYIQCIKHDEKTYYVLTMWFRYLMSSNRIAYILVSQYWM